MANKEHQNREEVVYKCNSGKCKGEGYHASDESRVIVLKLRVGKDCPLDFEDRVRPELQRLVDRAIAPAQVTPVAEVIPIDGVMTPRGHAAHMSPMGGAPAPAYAQPGQPTMPPGMQPGRKSPVPMELLRRGLQMNPPADQRLV